ncbi:hypothetical protein GGX14DRAFT_375954 [Mycena pura]|uniref:Uncharacterized protein n=1 Tax=Mycena pura TaxID=153505 RepID=A0AAD6UWI2_9AGAR|nr:hypothetical protein GGX14DRAFT_375954 [Mycena pura]
MPKVTSSPTQLAPARGKWIHKTHAMKTYSLGESDLDSILPISDEPNLRSPRTRVKMYNVRDVEALAQRLKDSTPVLQVLSPTTGFAVKKGQEIMRTTAMKGFKLAPCQMDRIKPVRELENPYSKAKGPMRFYNRCDVEVPFFFLQV